LEGLHPGVRNATLVLMSSRNVVTVDGLSGSGKTTLSRLLAEKLGFVHLNSGLLYRAIGFLGLRYLSQPFRNEEAERLLGKHGVRLALAAGNEPAVFINELLCREDLGTPEISQAASQLSAFPAVRKALLDAQRVAFPGSSLVAEGRDMGTVVFPEAPLKFFITAEEGVRAERRRAQLEKGGITIQPGDLEREIRERDHRDATRSISPTIPAPDAIILDNSRETLTSLVDRMYNFAALQGLANT
jgi:CMP/dCMP kinase